MGIKDSFEPSPSRLDLFGKGVKDILEKKAAQTTPAQDVNTLLNVLRNATTSTERAGALRTLRQYVDKLPIEEQAKVFLDPKVQKTIREIVADRKSPAAQMVKDLMKGKIGDIVKGLQAVRPDGSVDGKQIGGKVDVGNLLKLLQKDYKDIL